jgi:hypothetical protein
MTTTPIRAEIIGSDRASAEGMVTSGELLRRSLSRAR